MATTQKRFARGALATGSATLYTVPASTRVIIRQIIVCNVTSLDRTFSFADASGYSWFDEMALPAHKTYVANLYLPMIAGDAIAGNASLFDTCVYWITGDEYTL